MIKRLLTRYVITAVLIIHAAFIAAGVGMFWHEPQRVDKSSWSPSAIPPQLDAFKELRVLRLPKA